MYVIKNASANLISMKINGRMLLLAAGEEFFVPDELGASLEGAAIGLTSKPVKGTRPTTVDVEKIIKSTRPDFSRMPINQLRSIAKDKGLKIKRSTTKIVLIKTLEESV